ncbi:MAG: chromate transporter [Firmicutes bacterium]|jgi:chromate transporter|nr:chromate transporter [Bacillota bacterium]
MIYLQMLWIFFRLGLFTVGGGYAMLPLIQSEIERLGWITAEEFVDMIAIAEMTPGAIGVNTATFVGFRLGGLFGAFVATTGIALPSLLVVVAVSKVLDRFQEHPVVKAILFGIRPVVAGLIASAALFIAEAAIIQSGGLGILGLDLVALCIAVVSGILVWRYHMHPVAVIVGAGVVGLLVF